MSSVRTLRPGPPGQQARARYRQVRTQATATASEVLSELRDLTGHPPPAALVRGGGRAIAEGVEADIPTAAVTSPAEEE
jgi:hypothetical protein